MYFANWLQQQLNERGWSHSDLARRCNVTPAQISRVIAGSRGAGPDLCIAIAKGLNLPREEVFKARGWLLSDLENSFGPDLDPRVEKLAQEINDLPFYSRELALDAIEPVLYSIRKLSNTTTTISTNGQRA